MSGKTVLVVDDAMTDRLKMSLALKKLGHTVIEAKGGEEALKKVEEGAVDLIFLDMIMPDVDGLETLERLKAMQGAASPPVVVVSSIKNEDVVQRALSLGAVARLGKPFSADDLTAALEHAS